MVLILNFCKTSTLFFLKTCPAAGSSLGFHLQPSHEKDNGKQQAAKSCMIAGYTCCVPGCFRNSKIDKHLSFYSFPNGKSKEKQMLQEKWIHMICRKDFEPTQGHRVCSEHSV